MPTENETASALEALAQLTPEEREALTIAVMDSGEPTIQQTLGVGPFGGGVVVGPYVELTGLEGPKLGEAHVLAPGQAFGNRPWTPIAAPTEAEIRDVQIRTKFADAKIGISASAASIRRNLGVAILADTGGLIADVIEARARSYDHPNQIMLEQDREAFEARDAAHQARMQKLHPELREANRTEADRARMAAAEAKRQRRAQRQ